MKRSLSGEVSSPAQPTLFQELSIPLRQSVVRAVRELAETGGIEARGAIFTRREVVNFILDLVGYTVDRPLHRLRLLEPSFGGGDFLLPVVSRLFHVWQKASDKTSIVEDLSPAIRAVELHRDTYQSTRDNIRALLVELGLSRPEAETLVEKWLIQGDYLLSSLDGVFHMVVGNPPYVRQEMIADVLLQEYRARYRTLYDRADLYIPFIEKSLDLLAPDGQLSFICSDRWMKNRYGGPLRQLVADQYHLKVFVDMVDTDAFHSDVIAYPAITVIGRGPSGSTRMAHRPPIEEHKLAQLAQALTSKRRPTPSAVLVHESVSIVNGAEPWLLDASDQVTLLRRLEQEFPLLEEAGCKVGIGVATGADKAFIGDFDGLDVEPDRKLPLLTTKDIVTGEIVWRGQGVVNPFSDQGGLVNLGAYPRLRRYLETRRDLIASRHVAQKAPDNWYRTIDRITPELTRTPKLLIPDIKGEAHIVFDEGQYYPHHNLYVVTSTTWDLRALQAILLSPIAQMFIAAYSTKIRGGYLRFQAQYLRRIRIPRWESVEPDLRKQLVAAAVSRDIQACRMATFEVYHLSPSERALLQGES